MLAWATSGHIWATNDRTAAGQPRSPLAPSSAQLSNRTRPSVTGRHPLLGLSDTEVITPPGLTFDAGRLPHRAGGGPPVHIVVAKVLAAAPGQQMGSNRCP